MTVHSSQPPWQFLLSASKNSLQSFELSRLSNAANLRKEIGALLDQWLADQADAAVARLLLEERERSGHPTGAVFAGAGPAPGAHAVSDNLFADRAAPGNAHGHRS